MAHLNCLQTWVVVTMIMIITTVSSQDSEPHQALIENCNWPKNNVVRREGYPVLIKSPSVEGHDLVPNLVCQTEVATAQNPYLLSLRVNKFDLQGPDVCSDSSERIIIMIDDYNVTWCGKTFAKEMVLPVAMVRIVYNTGAYGEGSGFELEFSTSLATSCYENRFLYATEHKQLLYSPNFPQQYYDDISCNVLVTAEDGKGLVIRSRMMDIEDGINCKYDSLKINEEIYCGWMPINHIESSSKASITFHSDQGVRKDGFILEYSSMQEVLVDCSSPSPHLTVTNMIVRLSGNGKTMCNVSIDTGDHGDVLFLMLPLGLDTVRNFTIVVDGVTDISGYGEAQFDTPLRSLRTPGRKLNILGFFSQEMTFEVHSVQKDTFNTQTFQVHSQPSMVWISKEIIESSRQKNLILVKTNLSSEIEVKIYEPVLNKMMVNREEAYARPVAQYAKVANGPDMWYFQLTDDYCCEESGNSKSVYSFRSNNITVSISMNYQVQGYWLTFQEKPPPIDSPQACNLNAQTGRYSSPLLYNIIGNFHCIWKIPKDSAFMNRSFEINYNFNPDVDTDFLLLKSDAVGYDTFTYYNFTNVTIDQDRRLVTRSIIPLTLELFIAKTILNSGDSAKVVFKYNRTTEKIPRCETTPRSVVAEKNPHTVSTPQYPDFYQGTCIWNILARPGEIIVLEFPKMDCSTQKISVLPGLVIPQRRQYCFPQGGILSFQESQVKVEIDATQPYSPGFEFSLYLKETVSGCSSITSPTLQDNKPVVIQGYLLHETGRTKCSYRLYPGSYDTEIQIDVNDLIIDRPDNDDNIYITIFRLCGDEGEYKIPTSEYSGSCRTVETILYGRPSDPERVTIRNEAVEIVVTFQSRRDGMILFNLTATQQRSCFVSSTCKLTASPTPRTLTSLNYPDNYPNSVNKKWMLQAESANDVVQVEFEDFSLADDSWSEYCEGDTLSFYNGASQAASALIGTYCSSVLHEEITSTGPMMLIVFRADWADADRGFKLSFYSKIRELELKTADDQNSVAVVVGVCGGVLLLVVLVIAAVFIGKIWRRKRLAERQQTVNGTSNSGETSQENISGSVPSVHFNSQNSSIFFLNPVIINTHASPPPPYPEVVNQDGGAQHYSNDDVFVDPNLPEYYVRDSDVDPYELPPPYAPSMPGGPDHQSHEARTSSHSTRRSHSTRPSEGSRSRDDSTPSDAQDGYGSESDGVYQADNPYYSSLDPYYDDEYYYEDAAVSPGSQVYSLAQPFSMSDVEMDPPPPPPPAYESEEFLRNGGNRRDRRRVPKNGHLGPL